MRLRNSTDNHHHVKCEYSNMSWNDKQTVGSVDRSLLRHNGNLSMMKKGNKMFVSGHDEFCPALNED